MTYDNKEEPLPVWQYQPILYRTFQVKLCPNNAGYALGENQH